MKTLRANASHILPNTYGHREVIDNLKEVFPKAELAYIQKYVKGRNEQ